MTSRYTPIRKTNPGECDCCGFETPKLTPFRLDTTIAGGGDTVKLDFWFCELCYCTPASAFHRFPDQTPGNQELLRTICYVGNEILRAIHKRRTGST